ncbi:MAG: alpha/beta hydrolase [Rhizobiaceae bacterium]
MSGKRSPIAVMLVLASLLLASCGTSKDNLGIKSSAPQSYGFIERVFVATNRTPSDNPNILFSGERSDKLRFADITVSIPKDRKPGSVEFPTEKPNLEKQFAATSISLTDDEAIFASRLRSALAALPPEQRNIMIFVHGYNVPFAAGVFDQAQLKHDYEVPGVALHYSWPSAGKTPLYLYDRESAEFARSGLARTLKIAADAKPKSIMLIAHSMGTYLTMETMRSLSLEGQSELIATIDPLVLAAPDIDVDVFRSQLAVMKTRPKTMLVMVSEKDRALQFSSRLRGGTPRVGSGLDKEELTSEGIIVFDLAAVSAKGDRLSHSTFANSPVLIALAKSGKLNVGSLENNSAGSGNIVGETLGATGDLLSSIVYLPAQLVGAR